MSIIAKDSKGEFTPAPEGLWQAVCCDVVDQGMQTSQWGMSHRVQIRWQLEELDPKSGKPYMVVKGYRLSLHTKSALRPMLEAWRGKKFTAQELEGFDLEVLIGVNCQVQVIHNAKPDGNVYSNVQAVVPLGKGTPKLTVRGEYVRAKDRPDYKAPASTGTQGNDPDPDYDGDGLGDSDIPF